MGESNPPRRPTIRELARMANVSPSTVSRALRGGHYVREDIRARIESLAKEVGYRPDPEVKKLMHHLRNRRNLHHQTSICAIKSKVWWGQAGEYCHRVLDGVSHRADELGFTLQTFLLEDIISRPKWFSRVMAQRGVDGILFPPVSHPCEIPPEVRWEEFSIIAATHSVLKPLFHRVVPDLLHNINLICDTLYERGYRRFGLVARTSGDQRVRWQLSSAVAGYCLRQNLPMVPPLQIERYSSLAMQEWFKKEKPDTILVDGEIPATIISKDLELTHPGPIGIASSDCLLGNWPGINQHPELVGALAVDQLEGMIIRGEKGIPKQPTVLMVEGSWQEGRIPSATKVHSPKPPRHHPTPEA